MLVPFAANSSAYVGDNPRRNEHFIRRNAVQERLINTRSIPRHIITPCFEAKHCVEDIRHRIEHSPNKSVEKLSEQTAKWPSLPTFIIKGSTKMQVFSVFIVKKVFN
ncbi:hypothetical protein QE152_g10310 [Popillia japonica]|uniref:Uncharacterized protein n=1 Tax=Popillia japonica TaxID=7064 RepID=A0AAW1LVB3_POPJA